MGNARLELDLFDEVHEITDPIEEQVKALINKRINDVWHNLHKALNEATALGRALETMAYYVLPLDPEMTHMQRERWIEDHISEPVRNLVPGHYDLDISESVDMDWVYSKKAEEHVLSVLKSFQKEVEG